MRKEKAPIMRKGFDLYALNVEFADLLRKHDDDMDVNGESRQKFLEILKDAESGNADVASISNFWATAFNAYDELCSLHPNLRETFDWYCGAFTTPYPNNEYDLYIGESEDATFVPVRDKEPNEERSIWLRSGIRLTASKDDIEKVLQGDSETFYKLIQKGQYRLCGTYIPSCEIDGYNEEYGTNFKSDDVSLRCFSVRN